MKFDPNASPPCYRSKDEVIQKDTKVRIEIVGCRVEATDIVSRPAHLGRRSRCRIACEDKRRQLTGQFAIGTIKKDFLGQIRED